jgi:hypothetical protein
MGLPCVYLEVTVISKESVTSKIMVIEPGMVVHTYNLSAPKAEVGGWGSRSAWAT